MSAEVESMAYVGGVPWHGLGVALPETPEVDEMLIAAGLNWEVSKHSLSYRVKHPDGKNAQVKTDRCALVRDSDLKLLSVVPEDWKVCQNHEAFEFFRDFSKAGDLALETAGSLKEGQIVWALAKMRNGFSVVPGDETEQYLLLVNPHQYGKSISVRNTPVRVVCHNTLTLAIGEESEFNYSQSHRTVFDPLEVVEVVHDAKVAFDHYKERAIFLAKRKANEKQREEFFERVFPSSSSKGKQSRSVMLAKKAFESQPGAQYAEGTWWHAFNTVTYLTDHVLGKNQDTRLNAAWFGYNRKVKAHALNLATGFAKAA